MKKILCHTSVAFLLLSFVNLGTASVEGADCRKYLGKGYCTDYIYSRTRKRQAGDASVWKSNINTNQVRAGDAAIFSGRNHVAYVERVIYARNTATPVQVEISEWNWGPTWVDKPCVVTNMFAKTLPRNRIVSVNEVSGFWRP